VTAGAGKRLRFFIPLAVLIAVFAALSFFYTNRGKPSRFIRVTGIMDGVEVNLAPKVAGKISGICCTEGEAVAAGQVAVRIESEDIRASVQQASAGVERALAGVKSAEAAVRTAEANVSSAGADAGSARADIESTRARMEESAREADRAKALYKDDYIAKESRDQAVAAYEVNSAAYRSSKAKLQAAEERKRAAEAQLNASLSRLTASKAAVKEAEANLAYYKTKLADTAIKSPVAGTVIFRSLETGETVSPGVTVMTVVDLNSLYARVDIDETKVGSIALNSPASVRVEGMPGKVFKGRVSEIGRYAEFATQRDVVRGREDIKTFRVKVRVDDSGGLLKPGMTVEVEMPKKQ